MKLPAHRNGTSHAHETTGRHNASFGAEGRRDHAADARAPFR